MLPSSYIRRLRTKDLIQHNFPDASNRTFTRFGGNTFTRVDFADRKATHAYLPYLLRERTKTHHSSRVSGQINQVLERLSEIDKKAHDEELIFKRKLKIAFPFEKRDTPIPPQRLERQFSRVSNASKVSKLQPIKEGKESTKTIARKDKGTKDKGTKENVKKNKLVQQEIPQPIVDTIENLTRERMTVIAKMLMKDKRMSQCYKQNPNRIEIFQPTVIEATPAWSQEVKPDLFILVPIKSLRFLKWKCTFRDVGYLEITLPTKPAKNRVDVYAPLRADDEIHLSSSKLNKALVEVFLAGLKVAKFSDFSLMPELNFDYLTDTLELVYTKHLRIPLVPVLYLGTDEPYYAIKPNLPDLDPTSDTLFRACFIVQEENILKKISSTDNGLRMDALKVIHTLCKQDWRLQALSVFQLKNVLMHDIDFEIDHSPRWQRLTRDICVHSILKRLLYFVKKRKLPHFFQPDFDLFSGIPDKTLILMQTPLERLVSNEPQLLRDLQRASRSYESSDSSSESDEDWW
ncbi:uncharacterized protein LOC127878253 [Dreissena polymorpha]|uniref:Mab-21-like HhH/H2TH-like domain-containing protein n=1 Tax=Dreissena polymorpha TaxID=45954 RepID=A0A9D4RVX5_DREPO|nr:uncharacterized protein LOC127878253 [Dreissena polymorpha]KAH3880532.1 hypothetical protein DPMN_004448 [Dreissena polymorpha]